MRFFNTTGPVNCEEHYCLPPLERFDIDEIEMLIAQKKYFVLHAPRQTGKTSYLLALADYLNQQGHYQALYFNVESAQAAREDVQAGIQTILGEMASSADYYLSDSYVPSIWSDVLSQHGGNGALAEVLTRWSQNSQKPLVLLIDEIDSLVGDTLISVLRQLRSGYHKRPLGFPTSVILCGVRDVRDYRIHSTEGKAIITGGSAFNIKAESLRLGHFTKPEMISLLAQHTSLTGQVFEAEALDLAWELTRGQPWLVNALAYEVCFKMKEGRERDKPITAAMIDKAKEHLILRRETHLDQLVDKLSEERVRRVISPMLQGTILDQQVRPDDIQYVIDLGLVYRDKISGLQIANPIYREVIPRELSFIAQLDFEHLYRSAWYIGSDGRLDMTKLLEAFQQFFRENSELWIQRFKKYHEAGPHLLLQAFLQRIINSGGQVGREYALGSKRTDLLVIWPHATGVQRAVIELKLAREYDAKQAVLKEGLEQTYRYMDRCGADEGHLVIFDRYEKKSWDEKIYQDEKSYQGTKIKVWGM